MRVDLCAVTSCSIKMVSYKYCVGHVLRKMHQPDSPFSIYPASLPNEEKMLKYVYVR